MRILYAITAAEWGGASLNVFQLAEYMVKNGYEVGIVAAPEPRLMEMAVRLGIKIYPNPYFVRPVNPWKDFSALWPVFRAIEDFKPDIVHAHSTKAGYAARLACAVLHKPIIFTAHGWAFTEGRSYWKRKLLAWAERVAAKITDKIICVSEHDRKLALQWKVAKHEQLTVIYNGIDSKPFLEIEGVYLNPELGLKSSLVLTFVGRLAPPKDPFTLLEAVKDLNNDVVLLIVGNGELRLPVEKYIKEHNLGERVRLLGQRSDIPQILAASDIFVLSSRWEGLPYTIIEAMMAGLAVVATRVGGIDELVDDGVTGFLVPPKDSKALAGAIKKLIDNPEICLRMGQAGHNKAIKNFNLDNMLIKTHKVYKEVMNKRQ